MNKHTLEPFHSQFVDDELQHHGILGMKWGVRKDRKKSVNRAKNARNAAIAGTAVAAGRALSLAKMGMDVKKKYGHNPYASRDSRVRAAKHLGALAVSAGLAVYGTLQLSDFHDRRKNESRDRIKKGADTK